MLIADFHVDTLNRLLQLKSSKDSEESLWRNKGHIDIERLIKSNYIAEFFACFVDLGKDPIGNSHYDDVLSMIDIFNYDIDKHGDKIAFAGSCIDYETNKKSDKLSAILTLEEGGVIEDKIERVDELYNNGVRAITLTWNYENCLGYPNHMWNYQYKGLKPFGMEVLSKMDEIGIIADVSHLSDGGFMDIYKYGKKPFMATHSNARAIKNNCRNLTDDMVKKLAEKGGITGINFYGKFLQDDGQSTVESIMKHMRHIINVGGLDVVGIGTDFDGMSDEGLELKGAQHMPKLVEMMEQAKFTSGEIEAICYMNFEKFIKRYYEQ